MTNVKYYEHNIFGKDYVIGDLHGCYDELNALLKYIDFDKSKDRIFSVGDLIDRGPKSLECISLIYEPWFHAVRGNHEQMMIDTYNSSINTDSPEIWLYNGGGWSINENHDTLKILSEDMDKMLPYIIVIGKSEEKRINIVHAEIGKSFENNFSTDKNIDDFNFPFIDSLIWGRNIVSLKSNLENIHLSKTFCGHTPMMQPKTTMSHNFIDTAACYHHLKGSTYCKLTLVRLLDDYTYQYNMDNSEITESEFKNLL